MDTVTRYRVLGSQNQLVRTFARNPSRPNHNIWDGSISLTDDSSLGEVTMVEKDDWRLQGQEKYLKGVTLFCRPASRILNETIECMCGIEEMK